MPFPFCRACTHTRAPWAAEDAIVASGSMVHAPASQWKRGGVLLRSRVIAQRWAMFRHDTGRQACEGEKNKNKNEPALQVGKDVMPNYTSNGLIVSTHASAPTPNTGATTTVRPAACNSFSKLGRVLCTDWAVFAAPAADNASVGADDTSFSEWCKKRVREEASKQTAGAVATAVGTLSWPLTCFVGTWGGRLGEQDEPEIKRKRGAPSLIHP